ncbi:DciA family protein [Hydrogenimonas sp.]
MKKIETVLDHMLSHPTYAKLRQQSCFGLVKKALPATLQRGILFMYVKNRTLFFALKHPAFKMEFDYKLSLIKKLLSSLPPLQEACKVHEIEHVKAFVSKFSAAPEPKDSTEPRYRERAHSNFAIHAENEHLKSAFYAIRENVAKNRES